MADPICVVCKLPLTSKQSMISIGPEWRHIDCHQTHHADCWYDRDHHACAVAAVGDWQRIASRWSIEAGKYQKRTEVAETALATARAEALDEVIRHILASPKRSATGAELCDEIRALKDRRP